MPFTTLISTATLADQLSSCIVVDCRFDLKNESWGRDEYRRAHIPGAVYADLAHDLSSTPTGRNGRHPLPDPQALAVTLGRLGISNGTQVVAYDQDIGMWASRLWWMLRYMGHDAVAVLDGGWAKWAREGRPAASGEDARRASTFTPHVREGMVRRLVDVEAHLDDPAIVLVDARAPERFEGQSEPIDRTPGHIPGATNYCYRQNAQDDGTMRAPEALRASFEAVLGGHRAEEVVMYCGSGVSACHNLLSMEHAGLPGASLYVGSWSEWSSDPARPVETGKGRR